MARSCISIDYVKEILICFESNDIERLKAFYEEFSKKLGLFVFFKSDEELSSFFLENSSLRDMSLECYIPSHLSSVMGKTAMAIK